MTREDRAEDSGTEDVHGRYSVSWLFVSVDLADPGGERENAIAGHGKNETGRCDDCDAGTLPKVMSIVEAVNL